MKYRVSIINFAAVAMILLSSACCAAHTMTTAGQLLREKKALQGKIVAVEGIVRFDRLSQRGFLYSDLADLRSREYHKTIFLELGNEGYSSLRVPDRSWVLVTGYLSPEEHGPLGVYPAHIVVNDIRVQHRSRRK